MPAPDKTEKDARKAAKREAQAAKLEEVKRRNAERRARGEPEEPEPQPEPDDPDDEPHPDQTLPGDLPPKA